VDVAFISSPEYSTNPPIHQSRAEKWMEVEVTFNAAPAFTDELTFNLSSTSNTWRDSTDRRHSLYASFNTFNGERYDDGQGDDTGPARIDYPASPWAQ
jgi:hypothetical protein